MAHPIPALALVVLLGTCLSASAERVSLNATFPAVDNGFSLIGDPLMKQLPQVQSVVRLKSGQTIQLKVDDPGTLGLHVHPDLLKGEDSAARPAASSDSAGGSSGSAGGSSDSASLLRRASQQLEAVARKDASVDGAKPLAPVAKPLPAAAKKPKMSASPPEIY